MRIGEAEMQQSGRITRLIRDSSFRDYLDLFKFCSFDAKKSRHLDDLIRTYEIRGLLAESFYAGRKLAALHCFWGVQTQAASTLGRVKQTEFANNHFSLPFAVARRGLLLMPVSLIRPCMRSRRRCRITAEWLLCKLRMSMDHSPYAIRK